jgi:hypothetical protein
MNMQLKFYAKKEGYYYNRYFCFTVKKYAECINILRKFWLSQNLFLAVYIKYPLNNDSFLLDNRSLFILNSTGELPES